VRSDSRLSRMLHVLIHMDRRGAAATSETIAQMLNTNPVVVRRTMAGLRDQGYVSSEKGHGGGWTLARRLEDITLLDVHRALGEPHVFAIGPSSDDPTCLVEQAVNAAVGEALLQAQALLLARFGEVTLADLAEDFEARMRDVGPSQAGEG
jgi:DNA-binding IscR family transcriptional regulator